MEIFGKTDKGMVREKNEDSFALGILPDGAVWAVVCDGVGGSASGELASGMAAEQIKAEIISSYNEELSVNSIINLLTCAITNANAYVFDFAMQNPEHEGMGTTVVAAIVRDNGALIAHAGDSRAYWIKDDRISQITRDDSYVQYLVDTGKMTPQEAEESPLKNMILKCLGTERDLGKDFISFNAAFFSEGEGILLCSDGLTNMVSDEKIFSIIKENSVQDAVNILVDEANKNGGHDNVTVIVAR